MAELGLARDAFAAYDWPGKVRELQNVIQRALIGARGRLALHLPADPSPGLASDDVPAAALEDRRRSTGGG